MKNLAYFNACSAIQPDVPEFFQWAGPAGFLFAAPEAQAAVVPGVGSQVLQLNGS